MPMQPSPRAETSRPLFPSLRFCIIHFLPIPAALIDTHGERAVTPTPTSVNHPSLYEIYGSLERAGKVNSARLFDIPKDVDFSREGLAVGVRAVYLCCMQVVCCM